MVSQTPGPLRLTAVESQQARQIAESFGEDAERYDRTRPGYPDAMVTAVVAASPGPDSAVAASERIGS